MKAIGAEKVVMPDIEAIVTVEGARLYLKDLVSTLFARHNSGEGGSSIMKAYTSAIDLFLLRLYEYVKKEFINEKGVNTIPALIAMGGYGRGELNPCSDIDLMLLYPEKITPLIEGLTRRLLYILWDTGLDVGFSVRSIKGCLKLVKEDQKTLTALLDSRFITGDRWSYEELLKLFRKQLTERYKNRFVEAKLKESCMRQERYGGSIYLLEPNVKEGKGGLRDIHTALWIAQLKYAPECFYQGHATDSYLGKGFSKLEGLVEEGILSREEGSEIEASLNFLWRIRNDLHFNSRKKVDQLTFDAQERIARLLGYEDSIASLGVERFMRDYYLHANRLNHYSSLIIARLTYKPQKGIVRRLKLRKLDNGYQISEGMIALKDKAFLLKDPALLIKAFDYAQEFSLDIHPLTRELIISCLPLVDDSFRRSKEVNGTFLKMIKRGKGIYNALNMMHSLGFLSRYIPEFEAITCKVQHDLYHIYTVDTHSLFAVRELEALMTEGYRREFPILSSLLEEVERFDLLLLAVLFHDIGKVGGKGHAEKGETLTKRITERMNLSKEDCSLISFLVRNHLILANLAQYRDIHDLKLVVDFAKTVGNVENLNMLYLLTFADIRAVGLEVWTQWKSALFQELYFRARKVLEKGTFEIPGIREELRVIGDRVLKLVSEKVSKEEVAQYMKRFPSRYYLYNSPEAIALHLAIIKDLDGKGLVMHISHNTERVYTEVVVCTYDAPGLFSKIAGVMAANNVNILGAQINTSRDGIALNILQVTSQIGEVIRDEGKWGKIKVELKGVLEGSLKVDDLVGTRKPSILDKKVKPRVLTRIEIDNEVSQEFTVIDIYIQDRIGLLYDITSTLTTLGLYIYLARISTKGDEAADVFYVKDIFGAKVVREEKLKAIKETLLRVLDRTVSES